MLSPKQIDELESEHRRGHLRAAEAKDPRVWEQALADAAVQRKWLTKFQARELLRGQTRFTLGQYVIRDEIGRGGMGHVFKAKHAIMESIVAVKVLPTSKWSPQTEAAFKREIRMLAKLNHENIVRATDAGYDGKVHYLVTEYVPGRDLRRHVDKHGPLDQRRAALVIAQAARGLAYAHRQGFVHRDVKPGNILVTRDGRAKVLDLGLAGSLFDDESMKAGRRVGTPGYMAPEQIRSPKRVGPAADVYGLGCTLFFAVTGQPPFPGDTREEKERLQLAGLHAAVQALAPDITDDFAAVIEAMMRPSLDDRIRTAEEVIERLGPWLSPTLVPMPRGAAAVVSTSSVQSGSAPEAGSGFGSESASSIGSSHGGDTLRDMVEIDETSVASFSSDQRTASPADGLWRNVLKALSRLPGAGHPHVRRVAKAAALAMPLAVVGGLAGAVARTVMPTLPLGPGAGAILAFIAMIALQLALASPPSSGGRR